MPGEHPAVLGLRYHLIVHWATNLTRQRPDMWRPVTTSIHYTMESLRLASYVTGAE